MCHVRAVWLSRAFSNLCVLVVVTHQGDVEEVLVLLDLGEGGGDVGVEVVPPKAELLGGHGCWWAERQSDSKKSDL